MKKLQSAWLIVTLIMFGTIICDAITNTPIQKNVLWFLFFCFMFIINGD